MCEPPAIGSAARDTIYSIAATGTLLYVAEAAPPAFAEHHEVDACAGFSPDLLRDVERAEAADRERRAREFTDALRAITPGLVDGADVISRSWFELPLEVQDNAVAVRAAIDRLIREAKRPRTMVERVQAYWYGLTMSWRRPEVARFVYAAARFASAVDSALAEEARIRRSVELAIERDPEAQAEIARGNEDVEAGRFEEFTLAEFRQRFG